MTGDKEMTLDEAIEAVMLLPAKNYDPHAVFVTALGNALMSRSGVRGCKSACRLGDIIEYEGNGIVIDLGVIAEAVHAVHRAAIAPLEARIAELEARLLDPEEVAKIVYEVFYPGPIAGARDRVAKAICERQLAKFRGVA